MLIMCIYFYGCACSAIAGLNRQNGDHAAHSPTPFTLLLLMTTLMNSGLETMAHK